MKQFYIQNKSAGYCGNSPLFWERENNGYTPKLREAKLFTEDEANKAIEGCKGSHAMHLRLSICKIWQNMKV